MCQPVTEAPLSEVVAEAVTLKVSGTVAGVLLGLLAALPAVSQAPAPELGQLSFFVGDWSCKGRAEESPLGPAHATRGAVHIANDVGGFWYVGHYAEKKTAENPHP